MVKERFENKLYFKLPFFISMFLLMLNGLVYGQKQTRPEDVDSLIIIANKAPQDSGKAYLLEEIGMKLSVVNPEKGIEYSKAAIALAKQLGLKRREAAGLSILAINQAAQSEFLEGVNSNKRAIKIYDSLNDDIGMAGVRINLSQIYLKLGDYKNALACNYAAIGIYDSVKEYRNKAVAFENIGNIFFELKELKKSEYHYEKALKIYRDHDLSSDVTRCLGNKSRVYMKSGRYKEALDLLSEALIINRKEGNRSGELINLAVIGSVFMEMDSVESAIVYFNKALNLSKEANSTHNLAIAYGNRGMAFLHKYKELENKNDKLLRKATEDIQTGVKMCDSINYNGPLIEFSNSLVEAYQLSNNYTMAFNTLLRVKGIEDSLSAISSQKEIAELETKRLLDLKERDVIISENQLKIAYLNDQRDNLILLLIIAALTIFSVFVILIYNSSKTRHKKVIGEINQIQSHDIRGPVASILGLTTLYKESRGDSQLQRKIMEGIETCATTLDTLIREIIKKSNSEN